MEDIKKIKLFLDKRPGGVVQKTGTYGDKNSSDFYVNIDLYSEAKLLGDYVDVALDPTRISLQRQFINPFFYELGFFESIEKIGADSDLSTDDSSIYGKAKKYNITINK